MTTITMPTSKKLNCFSKEGTLLGLEEAERDIILGRVFQGNLGTLITKMK